MSKKSNSDKKPAIEKAWKAFYKRDYDGALEQFQLAVDAGEKGEALYGRACALFRAADLDGAIADLSELIKSDGKNSLAYHTRALAYGADEQYNKSLADLLKVTELEPANGEAWCDMGGLHLVLEDYMKARECFERSADIDKTCACAWLGKGATALFMKEYKKSMEYLNIAIKLDGKEVLGHMARADASFSGNMKKEALKDVRRALSLDKDFFQKFQEMFDEDTGDQDDDDADEKATLDDDASLDGF